MKLLILWRCGDYIGALPEMILQFLSSRSEIKNMTECLGREDGDYTWLQLGWNCTKILFSDVEGRIGIRLDFRKGQYDYSKLNNLQPYFQIRLWKSRHSQKDQCGNRTSVSQVTQLKNSMPAVAKEVALRLIGNGMELEFSYDWRMSSFRGYYLTLMYSHWNGYTDANSFPFELEAVYENTVWTFNSRPITLHRISNGSWNPFWIIRSSLSTFGVDSFFPSRSPDKSKSFQ